MRIEGNLEVAAAYRRLQFVTHCGRKISDKGTRPTGQPKTLMPADQGTRGTLCKIEELSGGRGVHS